MNVTDAHSTRRHMTALIEYAKALRISIQNINENSYNNFMMRIGKRFFKFCYIFAILPDNKFALKSTPCQRQLWAI